MEVHEAVRRRKKMSEEEENARKEAMVDAVRKAERDRVTRGMDAKEFSFAKEDRERQRKKEEDLVNKRREKMAAQKEQLFKAREVKLYFTENWEDIERRQDAERKQRVAARAAQMQSDSRLPSRMAEHEAQKKQEGFVHKESAAERTRKKLADKEAKAQYVPRVDPEHYTQTMRNKQRAWEEKLKATKDAVRAHATVPNRELPIERRQREYEEKRKERNDRDRRKEEKKRQDLREVERIAKEKALAASVAPPKMTNAYEQKIKALKKKRDEELAAQEKEEKDDARRRKKQDNINLEVRKMVAEMERERKAAFPGHYVDLDDANDKAAHARQQKEEEFKARQRALKDRLKEVQAVHKQQGGIIGATEKAIMKQKAKRKALSVVADAVGWRGRGGGDDDLFDEAEKAYLGFTAEDDGGGGDDYL
jgi:colicin import membrane protein